VRRRIHVHALHEERASQRERKKRRSGEIEVKSERDKREEGGRGGEREMVRFDGLVV